MSRAELEVLPNQRPVPELKIARSLESAGQDEIVLLDPTGRVLEQRRWDVLARTIGRGAGVGLLLGVAIGLAMKIHVVVGAVVCMLLAIRLIARMSFGQELRDALALVAAQRFDEADERLAALDEQPPPARSRAAVKQLRGGTAWVRGEHERALELYKQAAALSRGDPSQAGCYWLSQLARAELLVLLGRAAEAEAILPELDRAPRGELFVLHRQQLALAMAFAAGDDRTLPDTMVLHDWARAALLRNTYGSTLVYLAWAFGRRGEAGMAEHLLAEAESRLEPYLARSNPRLHEWRLAQPRPSAD